MREKIAIFKERNSVCRGPKFLNDIFFNGSDVDENRQFIERKMVPHYQDVMGAMLMKIDILLRERGRTLPKFDGGDVDENRHLLKEIGRTLFQILNIFEWGRC